MKDVFTTLSKTLRISMIMSVAALISAMSMNTQAAEIAYEGTVLEATGALATLITPVPQPLSGSITYDDAAILAGLASPADILDVNITVGPFCFALDPLVCAPGTGYVPVISIDAAAVTFSGGLPTGGTLDVTTFSSTSGIPFPIAFDFTAGTFHLTSALGDVSGTFYCAKLDGACNVVPIPATAWLFGSALLGLGALKRRKA